MKKQLLIFSLLALSASSSCAQITEAFRAEFPCELSIGHTWNRSLVKKAGQVIGARLKEQQLTAVLSPNLTVIKKAMPTDYLNLYGESPYLVAELGIEMVKGLQNNGQVKSMLNISPDEEQATYVSPYKRVLTEAMPQGGVRTNTSTTKADVLTLSLNKLLAGNINNPPTSDDFQKTALQVAQESIILLKNAGGLLPLDTATFRRVAVVGETEITSAMLPMLQQKLGEKCMITSATLNDLLTLKSQTTNEQMANAQTLKNIDAIIAFAGDDIDQYKLEALTLTGKPVVLVLLNTLPVALKELAQNIPAIIEAWHPGKQGMEAIADVLTGRYNPGGKLTLSFPEFPLGHGLSYTTFRYSDLKLEKVKKAEEENIAVSFKVTNIGTRAGSEVVQVYLNDESASVPLLSPKLEAFKRSNIQAGETKEIKFTIRRRNMELLNNKGEWVIEPGRFKVHIGASSEDIRLSGTFNMQ